MLAESSALSCIELLEKRVRSRFSGRQILFMPPPCPARALTILCDALLVPAPPDVPASPLVASGKRSEEAASGGAAVGGGKRKESEGGGSGGEEGRFEKYREKWNDRVEALRTRPEMHLAVEKVRLVERD